MIICYRFVNTSAVVDHTDHHSISMLNILLYNLNNTDSFKIRINSKFI